MFNEVKRRRMRSEPTGTKKEYQCNKPEIYWEWKTSALYWTVLVTQKWTGFCEIKNHLEFIGNKSREVRESKGRKKWKNSTLNKCRSQIECWIYLLRYTLYKNRLSLIDYTYVSTLLSFIQNEKLNFQEKTAYSNLLLYSFRVRQSRSKIDLNLTPLLHQQIIHHSLSSGKLCCEKNVSHLRAALLNVDVENLLILIRSLPFEQRFSLLESISSAFYITTLTSSYMF
jgi:hypothetical protein